VTDKNTSAISKQAPEVVPVLSESAESRLRELVLRYPQKKSAVMPALYIAQEELGWISPEALAWVANRLELQRQEVFQVSSFYTMYYKKPVGLYHVQLCRTLSCMLCGSRTLGECLKTRLGVSAGEVTSDGLWSYEEVECLGSCGTGPVAQINDVFFEKLTPETLLKTMDRIEREKPDLRYSCVRESLGEGLSDCPRSQIFSAQNAECKCTRKVEEEVTSAD